MVNYHCIAIGCNNDSRKKDKVGKYPDMLDSNGNIVEFFVLPSAVKYQKQRRAWIEALRRANFNPGPKEYWHSVCSRHFVDNRPTKENPIPTLFSYNNYQQPVPRETHNSRRQIQVAHESEEQQVNSEELPVADHQVRYYSVPVEDIYRGIQYEISINSTPTSKENKKEVPVPEFQFTVWPVLADHNYAVSKTTDEKLDMDRFDLEVHCTSIIQENDRLKERCSYLEREVTRLQNKVRDFETELKETKWNKYYLASK